MGRENLVQSVMNVYSAMLERCFSILLIDRAELVSVEQEFRSLLNFRTMNESRLNESPRNFLFLINFL